MTNQRDPTARKDIHLVRRDVSSGRLHDSALRDPALRDPTLSQELGRQFMLVLVPQLEQASFRRFCQLNSKACPVIRVLRAGTIPLPFDTCREFRAGSASYDIYSFGEHFGAQPDIQRLWRKDLVGFALGSSAALEPVLRHHGIRFRGSGPNQRPRYITRFKANSVGPFSTNLVVSMRPVARCDVDRLCALAARHPEAHGAPVHIGDPEPLGIANLARPTWGFPIKVGADEVPVFFASSLTAQRAVATAPLAFSITSTPDHGQLIPAPAQYTSSAFVA